MRTPPARLGCREGEAAGTVEPFAGYWPCCDRLGREAVKAREGWTGPALGSEVGSPLGRGDRTGRRSLPII